MIRFIYCKLIGKKFNIGPNLVGMGMADAFIDVLVIAPIVIFILIKNGTI